MRNANKIRKVLFVCTGNTCRSSMAGEMFRALLNKRGISDVEVISAGTSVLFPSGASSNAIKAMELRGLNLSTHQSRQVNMEMIRQADLILTMTTNHLHSVVSLCPEAADKTFTLKEYAFGAEFTGNLDIIDPYGQSLESYRMCADEIEQCLEMIIGKL